MQPFRPSLALCGLLLTAALAVAGCKPKDAPAETRSVRTMVVDYRPVVDDRYAIGEVRPRYESDLSFRVAGKVLARRVDLGASVKRGDVLARLDTQDYENRLRSAEADVRASEAAVVEAQSAETRQARLLKDGWTPRASYDTALRNLHTAEAKRAAARAALALARDQLRYTELKADFDGVVTAVGAEAGQNVNAGQMVVRLARPDDKDGVFTLAETALTGIVHTGVEVVIWPLASPRLATNGVVREIAPVADPATRTYAVKVTLENPPPQIRFGMSIGGRLKERATLAVALPLSAVFDKDGAPAVWVFDPRSATVDLRRITLARYEANAAIVRSGLAKGDIVVTAGVNTLRTGQKVRLAQTASGEGDIP
jgi:RND family efflux transporter MFP subunit